jgi:hypothetical protein
MTSIPPSGDPDQIRASNADREHVVQQLNDAFAEGRLDVHELDERVAGAYAAKTLADLRPLTVDLPGGTPSPPAPRRPGEPARRAVPTPPARPDRWPAPAMAYRGLLTAVAINVVIWAVVSLATGQLIYFWPIWVALPLLILIVRHVVGGGWTQRDRDRQQRRRARRRGW